MNPAESSIEKKVLAEGQNQHKQQFSQAVATHRFLVCSVSDGSIEAAQYFGGINHSDEVILDPKCRPKLVSSDDGTLTWP